MAGVNGPDSVDDEGDDDEERQAGARLKGVVSNIVESNRGHVVAKGPRSRAANRETSFFFFSKSTKSSRYLADTRRHGIQL